MRILFIGGTGNISTECAELLHQRGHELLILSRGRSPVPSTCRALQADRRDATAMRAALAGQQFQVVLNFLGYDLADVQADFELFRDRVQQYIFISSATVYARPPTQLPITEAYPLGNPFWDYAQRKIACEEWLNAQHRQNGFPVTIVRPSHTYSKLWIPNPVSSAGYAFAARLEQGKAVIVPNDGENPWTLTASSDFAVGLAGLIGRNEAIGQAFHITSDEVLTWNQIVQEIARAVGATSPQILKIPADFICRVVPEMTGTLKGDKIYPGVFDNSKIKRFVPEFRCSKPFRQGLQESLDWLRQNPADAANPKVDEVCDAVLAAWPSSS
jgi:nucleoside-diphosphate-sugar epimerase